MKKRFKIDVTVAVLRSTIKKSSNWCLIYLAQGFETCRKSDPKVTECLSKAIQSAMYLLRDGEKFLKL